MSARSGSFASQYWQVNLSRKNTLKRVKAGVRLCAIYSLRQSQMARALLVMPNYYFFILDMIVTRSKNTALRCFAMTKATTENSSEAESQYLKQGRADAYCVHGLTACLTIKNLTGTVNTMSDRRCKTVLVTRCIKKPDLSQNIAICVEQIEILIK